MEKRDHIIAVRLSAMGDVAMTVPILRALVFQNPKVQVTMVSRPFLKPLFDNIPGVNFFGADVDRKYKGLPGIYKLSKDLKQFKPDLTADLHNVLRTQILRSFLSFSVHDTAVIDKGRREKKELTRPDNKIFKPLRTTCERYADVFRKLGYKIDLSEKFFTPGLKISKETELIIDKTKNTFVGIAPFAQYDSKIYPLDLMEKVIKDLSKEKDLKILLFGGGRKEVEKLKETEKKFDNTISLAGKLSFKQELEIISNLDVMLSMDSANAHLASMYGVKTITLWGVTHPHAGFAPYGQPLEYCIVPDLKRFPKLPCSVYGNKVCEGYEDIMRNIRPEEIVDTIKKVIKKP